MGRNQYNQAWRMMQHKTSYFVLNCVLSRSTTIHISIIADIYFEIRVRSFIARELTLLTGLICFKQLASAIGYIGGKKILMDMPLQKWVFWAANRIAYVWRMEIFLATSTLIGKITEVMPAQCRRF